tara:strand:+ start:136 stop:330 length:195 start_codon:yes stop_codon:yes gene_type:complete
MNTTIEINKGDRVRLVYTDDDHTDLSGGDEGTVNLIDDFGTIHVFWDKGNHLGLIPGHDEWLIL